MSADLTKLLDRIEQAVALRSDDAGVRAVAAYEPANGTGAKIFPPTYPFGDQTYALEERFDAEGNRRTSVLIDSFQSQANRCELAILDAVDDGLLSVPYIQLVGEVPMDDGSDPIPIRITSLEAPHRSPDAYFRDSEDAGGVEFDKTEVGAQLRRADLRSARALFQHVPTDLIYGFWDSQRGGRGLRLARAYTSEMYGWDPQVGRRGAGRLDPMNIEKARIAFPAKHPGDFVVLGDGPVPKGMKESKPSAVGHGNAITSDGANPGVSVTGVQRSAFISAAALARLRFPDGSTPAPEADVAARSVLFALALAADRLTFDRPAVFLRSGCELITAQSQLGWVGRGAEEQSFELSITDAVDLVEMACERASAVGIPFASEPLVLQPKQRLVDLLSQTFSSPASEE